MNTDFARQQMIEQQVRAWDVLDERVLDTLKMMKRERFVPEAYATMAFADTEIPLDHGQLMMTPTIEGRVLQALLVGEQERVLEIGTGSGFLTACLAALSSQVTSIDIFADFLETAGKRLLEAEINNVELLEMDATKSLPDGTFDAIAVTGSVQIVNDDWLQSLNVGGRLFVVVGDAPAMSALCITRTGNNDWQSENLFETDLMPLINGALPPQFSF